MSQKMQQKKQVILYNMKSNQNKWQKKKLSKHDNNNKKYKTSDRIKVVNMYLVIVIIFNFINSNKVFVIHFTKKCGLSQSVTKLFLAHFFEHTFRDILVVCVVLIALRFAPVLTVIQACQKERGL